MHRHKTIHSKDSAYAISRYILFWILFPILLIAFTSTFVSSDEIRSDGKMAIGVVNISCSGNSTLQKEGFCDKVFREIIFENHSVELQLFDIKPNYTFCKIDCHINEAEIYDLRGNRLNLTIIRDYDQDVSPPAYSLLLILLMLFLILLLVVFKSKSNMTHKMKKNKKKNDIS